ncbi:uncharacterized protein LOC123319205 [Coccinella septempunctata]|uniref:uncharacterized protein LOC123319205 n=1 Tax=Coccinella septempunctata TaxID=41139 RepID=UPI001D06FAC6|nr:uncharacterized protein LOC123319205 [Coccinella septempunctata]
MEASETASGVETAPGGRPAQSLVENSEASGATLRNGTTRPRRSNRIGGGNSLDRSTTQDNPAITQKPKRQHWTREMNVSLINAYFEATEGETKTKKYAEKLAGIWAESHPGKPFTGKHLIAQVKNIKTRKLLALDEIEAIKANIARNSMGGTVENIRRSIQRRSTTAQPPTEEDEREHQLIEPEFDEVARGMRTLYQQVTMKWEGIEIDRRPKIPRIDQNQNTRETVQAVNNALGPEFKNARNLEELCHTVYCAATVTSIILKIEVKKTTQVKRHQQRPPWEERIQKKIINLRKEIGVLHAYLNNTSPSTRVENKIKEYTRKLKLKKKEPQYKERIKTYTEGLKQRIAALGNRLRRYNKRTQRYRDNNLFANNQRQFFRKLDEDKNVQTTKTPSPTDMHKYWSKIWSNKGTHNTEATWIEQEKKKHANLQEMSTMNIEEEDVKNTIKRMKNWTTPGIDGIHNFWWKSFSHTHQTLAQLIQEAIENPNKIPKYFTHGTTLMLPKKGDLTQPENYRPITCLPSAYKIITSTIGHKIRTHLKTNNIMAWEQAGCRENGRGSKELLMIDSILTRQAKRKLKNLSMAWIDYRKAYDSVPHSWLLEVLEIYKVDKKIINLIESLRSMWRTTLTVNTERTKYNTEEIKIEKGIFQGDGLSPLLFCLALNPLSNMLNRSEYGYKIEEQKKITHLFYMDDLKLYARGKKQLEGELELVRRFSTDIGMRFSLEKCATVEVKRGKLVEGENIRLADGREMANMKAEDRYKYLGIQQTYEIKQQENKKAAETELIRRTRKIVNSQLSAKNKINAINIWAIPTFTYTAGILNWSKTDLENLDRRIRTTLTQQGMLHPNSAIERLYLPRKEGGRGLSSLEHTCLKEEKKLTQYFEKNNLPLHQWIAAQRRIASTSRNIQEEDPAEKLRNKWKSKALHGRFFNSLQQPEVDMTTSNTYLKQGYLFPQTEGTLQAIQDQVVPTRTYLKHILQQQVETTKCRLCNSAEETVQHLTSGCTTIANTKYLTRHDNMGKVVHQLICLQKELIPHFTPHHVYAPQTLKENEQFKIYWDLTIITDRRVVHNRPDMVIFDKVNKTAIIIDFAVPQDQNLTKTYTEKMTKYEALAQQIRDMWKLRDARIMPLIISANGLVHRKTTQHLLELKLPQNTIMWMQKAVILGTVNIIRKTLYPH